MLAGILWKPVRAVVSWARAVQTFIDKWNGTPDQHDASGALTEEGTPGVPAILEKVRSQVENSHSTNLRDDVDELRLTVKTIGGRLDDHIKVAELSDARHAETAEQVDKLAARWASSAD